MEHLVSQIIGALGGLPVALIYLLAAIWVGLESMGIGVPIEPVMLFLGSLVALGTANLVLAVLALATGCLLFASIAYTIGARAGTPAIARIGRYIGLTQVRADHLELWLRNRGLLGVVLARETPLVRTFASYIMGAARIPFPVFALGTFAGSLIYCGVWVIIGDLLGENYKAPLRYLDRLGAPGIAALAFGVVAVIVIHHFLGRLSRQRIARHFVRHHVPTAVNVPAR